MSDWKTVEKALQVETPEYDTQDAGVAALTRLRERVQELERERDVWNVDIDQCRFRVAQLEEALREIKNLPSEHDLLFNAVARAQYEIARRALEKK